jgi:hypothetical protein
VGKSPTGYGTSEGRHEAKAKYETPKDDKRTANPGELRSEKMEKKAVGLLSTIPGTEGIHLPIIGKFLQGAERVGANMAKAKPLAAGVPKTREQVLAARRAAYRSGPMPIAAKVAQAFGDELAKIAFATSQYSTPLNPTIFSGASHIPAFRAPQLQAGIQKKAQPTANAP